MGPSVGGVVAGFVILAFVFWPIERWRPSVPGQRVRRRGFGTDVAYWAFTPLVTRWITRAAAAVAVVLVAAAAGAPLDKAGVQAFLTSPERWVRGQPAGLQVLEVLLLGDLIGYFMHRLFHRRPLWRFHAVHHSSTELDWLSAVRLHPLNDLVMRLASAVPLLMLGFSPLVLAAYLPFLSFYAILLHANVGWGFGPLRYVLASPAFHRWHHTSEDEGLDRNFAGLFPFIDLLFGTFQMPARPPSRFGLRQEAVPEGLIAQLAWPFRKE